jgi:hypothetical protein
VTTLSTTLPGKLVQRQSLTTTLTYVSSDPEGKYGVVTEEEARTQRPGPHWRHLHGTGVMVTRVTGDRDDTTVRVAVTRSHGSATPIGVLVDSPDDVQDFLTQYAPEVWAHYEAWERGDLLEQTEERD